MDVRRHQECLRSTVVQMARPAHRSAKTTPTAPPVTVVLAREIAPPDEGNPIEWLLLTTLPVTTGDGGDDMAVNKDTLHRLIDRLDELTDIETVYAVVKSLVEHDDQAWYCAEPSQQGEQEADADKIAGRISRQYTSATEFMKDLTQEPPDEPR